MSDPVFKILRCDAEASHMLGFAKKEVRRLIDYAKLDSFKRTWKFGDVTVDAHYFGGVARLALSAEGTERMAVWATLPNPVPYRGVTCEVVNLGEIADVYQTLRIFSSDTTIEGNPGELWPVADTGVDVQLPLTQRAPIYGFNGETIGTHEGTWSWVSTGPNDGYYVAENWYMPAPMANVQNWSWSFGLHPLAYPAGAFTTYRWTTVNGVVEFDGTTADVSSVSYGSVFPSYEAVQVSARGDYAGGLLIGVSDSNGDVVAEMWSQRFAGGAGRTDADIISPRPLWATTPGVIPTQVVVGGALSAGPSILYEANRDGVLFTRVTLPQGGSFPLNSAAVLHSDSIVRWLSTASDAVLAQLASNEFNLPSRWANEIKLRAPRSNFARMEHIPDVDVGPLVVISDSREYDVLGLKSGAVRYAQVVTIRYAYTPAGAEEVLVEDAVTGIADITATRHTSPSGSVVTVLADTYENWYGALPDVGAPLEMVRELSLIGDLPAGVGFTSPVFPFYTGTVVSSPWVADSTYETVREGDAIGETSWVLYKFLAPYCSPAYRFYAPVIPAYSSTVRNVLPQAVLDFYRRVKPVYDAAGGDKSFLSSGLVPGAWVKVVLVGRSTGDSGDGLFSRGGNPSSVVVYGVVTLKFSYPDGGLTVSSWSPAPDGGVRIPTPEGYTLRGNALVIYGGIKWDDVKEQARAQRKALNDPNDPQHDPLMKAVLDALKQP